MKYKNSIVNDSFHNVTVQWNTTDSALSDIEYMLSVTSSQAMIYNTTELFITLTLRVGVNYSISLTAQRCDGALASNTSNVLPIFIDPEGIAT